MNDVKKLLARIGAARDAISRKEERTGLDFMIDGVLMNCAVMLKEQETANLYKCPNCGTWVSAENVVQCKDCEWWDKGCTEECDNSDSVCFRNGRCEPHFYCGDGEKSESV